jgi:hypothetical protein
MGDKKSIYNNEYLPFINRTGRLTGFLGVCFSFLPALTLAVIYHIVPPISAVITAFISIASAVGTLWFIEPISYFPVVGVAGTYMAFLSGNISNMRVPCAAVAQTSAGVEPGTEEGSIISTLGMAVSIVINIAVLTLGVIVGSAVLSKMPAVVLETLNYLLPALFGALFVQFAVTKPKMAPISGGIGILLSFGIARGWFNWLPGASNYLAILGSVFISIFAGVAMYKSDKKKENGNA